MRARAGGQTHKEVYPVTSIDLARFLGIGEKDVSCVLNHAEALAADADALSAGFYGYLQDYPETGRLLGDFGIERMRDLSHLLAENFRRMLRLKPGESRQDIQSALGSVHYRAGVMTTWVVGAYRLYVDYLHDRLAQLGLDDDDRRRLDKALIKYVFYDMILQLEGYEQARLSDLGEGDAVARAVLEATLTLDKASAPEDVLTSICDRVVSASGHLRAAWFCLGGHEPSTLTPAYHAGDRVAVPDQLSLNQDDPIACALREQRPLVFDPTVATSPDWSRRHPEVRTIGIFPFGLRNTALTGCFVVHADMPRYFNNTGLTIFEALATLAQLLMELRDQVQRDALTGLANREAFSTHLSVAVERAARDGRLVCVGILDLDDFKPINDRYGHAAGDDLLRMLAERLRQSLRGCDMVARLSGDEFALILESIVTLGEAERVFERIEKALGQPFVLPDGTQHTLNASLGVTIYPFDESPPMDSFDMRIKPCTRLRMPRQGARVSGVIGRLPRMLARRRRPGHCRHIR
ncbi:hypothetical protein BI364_07905 [Acidihalobacter yilgarnensis]|uniref:Diguanylate cyclase DosC n=1 Tax=Acidihalobacter yilgarnensis TaxID=2819280 RepID=A0A1D8IN59_9GAMM|nr:hypothetical protein BI364_07905 [Acidihalobacter yilgarnensis]